MLPQDTAPSKGQWNHDGPSTGTRTKLNKIMDFIANIGSNICGFRYEFVFYATQSLCRCHEMIANHSTIYGVPSELEIAQCFIPEMYKNNVQDAIKQATPLILRGATNATPTLLQKKVMIELLNTLGFFSEKWGNLLGTSTRVIREEAKLLDMDAHDKTIQEICKAIYVRKCPTNPSLLCAITVNTGSVTRAFANITQLAKHIYRQYRQQWNRYIRSKNKKTDNDTQWNEAIAGPDMYGIFRHCVQLLTTHNSTPSMTPLMMGVARIIPQVQ